MKMKLISRSVIGLLFLFQAANVFGLEGKLLLDPARPLAGKTIRFTYMTSEKDKPVKSLSASLLYYSPTNIDNCLALDISLQEQGDGVYKGVLQLPKDALAFALAFRAGEAIDTN